MRLPGRVLGCAPPQGLGGNATPIRPRNRAPLRVQERLGEHGGIADRLEYTAPVLQIAEVSRAGEPARTGDEQLPVTQDRDPGDVQRLCSPAPTLRQARTELPCDEYDWPRQNTRPTIAQ
jgi:hypothetical protein